MRHRFALMALLLPLGGCVVPPDQVGYGYGYPGAYPQPGYPAAYPQPDYGYPGFSYYDGSPTLAIEGATVPLIFYGGGWGYWDNGRRWHRAPEGVERHLDQRFPGGAGYRAWGGGPVGHPEGPRVGAYQGGNPWAGRPGGPAPGAPPPGGGWQGRSGGPPPGGGGFAGRPAGPPAGGPPPAAPAPRNPLAAAVGRVATPPPAGHRQDDHH